MNAARANSAYDGVRDAFMQLGLDFGSYDTPRWNPLNGLISPGNTVVLKPNFVRHFRESSPDHADCLTTHGAVIRAVLDYVFIAIHGRGRIVIADAPQNDADFASLRRMAGLDEIQDLYRREAGFDVEVYDLRQDWARKIDGVIVGHAPLPGDPAGYVRVNLAGESAFAAVDPLRPHYYGAEYDCEALMQHHDNGVHEYLISRTLLDADCVISLPKMKTHKKTGITCNLKNMVGINGDKNWLPHHRQGTPAEGGDEFADSRLIRRLERASMVPFRRAFPSLGLLRPVVAGPLKALGKRVFGDTMSGTVRSGNWHGNDTTWRMVHDLNRVLRYAASDGTLGPVPARRMFSVVDGIVAGEGNGPLDPSPKPAGLVLAGEDFLAVDLAACRLMGFDFRRMPMLARGSEAHRWPLSAAEIECVELCSQDQRFNGRLDRIEGPALSFRPHFGWLGNVEL